jgi:DNA-binding MarR family transcriptional regulator
MTPREHDVLRALTHWTGHMRRPPALHELAEFLGLTRTPVYDALVHLELKGYVMRNDSRQFVVVP